MVRTPLSLSRAPGGVARELDTSFPSRAFDQRHLPVPARVLLTLPSTAACPSLVPLATSTCSSLFSIASDYAVCVSTQVKRSLLGIGEAAAVVRLLVSA